MIELPNGIDLRNCDWQDLLVDIADDSVDLILTDPPYAISKPSGYQNTKIKKYETHSIDFGKWDENEIDLEKFCHESYRVLRSGGTLILWYDVWKVTKVKNAMESAGFKMLRLLTWQKSNPVPINAKVFPLSNASEYAVASVKNGKPTFHGDYFNGVYNYPIPKPKGGRIHPTQKHDDLFTEIIEKHSNENDLICDPFSGSGTTAVACHNTGRKFIGCEINQEYYEKSLNRFIGKNLFE